MSGYVKLFRSVRSTAIADNPEYFAAWVHLLCKATYKEHTQVVGRQTVTLQPGQLVFGRDKFSRETGISENKVRAALDVMKRLGMITSKSHVKFSVISICNWSQYQEESPANNQEISSKSPAPIHKQEGTRRDKKGQEEILCQPPKGDDVPYQEVIDLYHEILPELPKCLKLTDPRKRLIRARWNDKASVPDESGEPVEVKCNNLDFWRRYFNFVRGSPFLMGQTEAGFRANLDFLLRPQKMVNTLEGFYDNGKR